MTIDDLYEKDIKQFLHREIVTRIFWEKLVAEVKTQIDNRNVGFRSRRLLLTEESDSLIRVEFLQHELRAAIDMRTGMIRYAYISPEFSLVSPELSDITDQGTIQLDPESSFFKAIASPDFRNVSSLSDSDLNSVPLYQVIAEHFVDKLLIPPIPELNRLRTEI